MSDSPMRAANRPRVITQLSVLVLLALLLAACNRGGTNVPPVGDDHSAGSVQVRDYTRSGDTVTISAPAAGGMEWIQVGSGTVSASGLFSWELQVPSAAALHSWEDSFFFSATTPSDLAVRLAFADHFDVDDVTDGQLLLSYSEYPGMPEVGTVHGFLVYADRTATFTFADTESGHTATVTLQAGWNIFVMDYLTIEEGMPFQSDVLLRTGTPEDLFFFYQVPMPG